VQGYIEVDISPVRFRFVFPQERVFNNFLASFFGSFRFIFGLQSFFISNLPGLFFEKSNFLSYIFRAKLFAIYFHMFMAELRVQSDCLCSLPQPLHTTEDYHTRPHLSRKIRQEFPLFFPPGVAAGHQLICKFEWRTRLASLRLPKSGVCVFAENKAPAPDFSPRFMPVASLK